MKRISLTLVFTVLSLLLTAGITNGQTNDKVFWMATVEVSLGKLEAYHSFNSRELLPVMMEHGYNPVVTWQTIIGDIEQVIFVAEFENMDVYNKARESLLDSADWQHLSKKFDSLTKGITTKFLKAASYSELQ